MTGKRNSAFEAQRGCKCLHSLMKPLLLARLRCIRSQDYHRVTDSGQYRAGRRARPLR